MGTGLNYSLNKHFQIYSCFDYTMYSFNSESFRHSMWISDTTSLETDPSNNMVFTTGLKTITAPNDNNGLNILAGTGIYRISIPEVKYKSYFSAPSPSFTKYGWICSLGLCQRFNLKNKYELDIEVKYRFFYDVKSDIGASNDNMKDFIFRLGITRSL